MPAASAPRRSRVTTTGCGACCPARTGCSSSAARSTRCVLSLSLDDRLASGCPTAAHDNYVLADGASVGGVEGRDQGRAARARARRRGRRLCTAGGLPGDTRGGGHHGASPFSPRPVRSRASLTGTLARRLRAHGLPRPRRSARSPRRARATRRSSCGTPSAVSASRRSSAVRPCSLSLSRARCSGADAACLSQTITGSERSSSTLRASSSSRRRTTRRFGPGTSRRAAASRSSRRTSTSSRPWLGAERQLPAASPTARRRTAPAARRTRRRSSSTSSRRARSTRRSRCAHRLSPFQLSRLLVLTFLLDPRRRSGFPRSLGSPSPLASFVFRPRARPAPPRFVVPPQQPPDRRAGPPSRYPPSPTAYPVLRRDTHQPPTAPRSPPTRMSPPWRARYVRPTLVPSPPSPSSACRRIAAGMYTNYVEQL